MLIDLPKKISLMGTEVSTTLPTFGEIDHISMVRNRTLLEQDDLFFQWLT